MKVSPQEIKEMLEEGIRTKADLADYFGVCIQTIGTKMKALREDGEAIIHTQNGYVLIDSKEMIEKDPIIAKEFSKWLRWGLGCVKGWLKCTAPTHPFFPAMKRTLALNQSKEERREIMQLTAGVAARLALLEAYEEDQE